MAAFYAAQLQMAAFLGRRYMRPAADFFVETIVFCLSSWIRMGWSCTRRGKRYASHGWDDAALRDIDLRHKRVIAAGAPKAPLKSLLGRREVNRVSVAGDVGASSDVDRDRRAVVH
jgi:hypothetical protein